MTEKKTRTSTVTEKKTKTSIKIEMQTAGLIKLSQKEIITNGLAHLPQRVKEALDIHGGGLPSDGIIAAGCEALLMALEGTLVEPPGPEEEDPACGEGPVV